MKRRSTLQDGNRKSKVCKVRNLNESLNPAPLHALEMQGLPTELPLQNNVPLRKQRSFDQHATNSIYPTVWTQQQWLERKQKHPWLVSNDGYLGCNDCYVANALGHLKSSLNVDWINCKVAFNGTNKIQNLRSLRKKISAHQLSSGHKKALSFAVELQNIPSDASTSCESEEVMEKGGAEEDHRFANEMYPAVWSQKHWLERKLKYPWLIANDGFLGCNDCNLASSAGEHKAVTEWARCKITSNGGIKIQQLKSLRKKIYAHHTSLAHKKSQSIVAHNQHLQHPSQSTSGFPQPVEGTEKVINTAYYLAKTKFFTSELEHLLELQLINGVDLDPSPFSAFGAEEIIDHIALEFRRKFTTKLVSEERKISIILEEMLNLNRALVLVIYVKTFLTDEFQKLVLLDLIAPADHHPISILDSLFCCLASYGLGEAYLRKNLICFATEGSSKVLGKMSGLGELLKSRLQLADIITWSCLNHRLELIAYDSLDETNNYEDLLQLLQFARDQSLRISSELQEISPVLSSQLKNMGYVTNLRWVFCNFHAVYEMWTNYPRLVRYFHCAADDEERTRIEREKCRRIYETMTTSSFVRDLSLIFEVSKVLSDLTLELKDASCSLGKAERLIKSSVSVLEAMRNSGGEREIESEIGCQRRRFKEIDLAIVDGTSRIKKINREKYLNEAIERLECCCFETEKYKSLFKELEVLNPESWCDKVNNFQDGEERIRNLCVRFRLDNKSIVKSFEDFFIEGGRKIPKNLSPLVNVLKTLPFNSIECRKGLDFMNSICSQFSTIPNSITNISALLLIKFNGPPLSSWNASPLMPAWLQQQPLTCNGSTQQLHNSFGKDGQTLQ